MPYPFPEEPDVNDFVYFLVAIPDAPEYRQAAKGAFTELGRASAWGLEKITSGSYVAAQAWLRAVAETWRLLEMGWPDLLLSYIDEVETLLTQIKTNQQYQLPCCDSVDMGDIPGGGSSTDPVPQPVIDAGYATGVDDQAGYADYRCLAAHLFIDTLQLRLTQMQPIVELGGVLLGAMLTVFGAAVHVPAVAVGGLLVGLPELVQLIDALKDLSGSQVGGLAATVDENRDEIICAMLSGDGIDDMIAQFDAIINTIFSFPGNVVIRMMNIRHTMQLYMYGEDGPANIAQALADAGYDPGDYTCCPDEPPDGYQIVPVTFTSCVGTCTGVSIDGNTITFTGYTNTGGIAALLTEVLNVRGSILLCDLDGPDPIEMGGTNCGNKEMLYDGAILQNGYTFAFSHNDHQTAFAAYMALHLPNANVGNTCCTSVARLAIKKDNAGTLNGTVQAWLILDA